MDSTQYQRGLAALQNILSKCNILPLSGTVNLALFHKQYAKAMGVYLVASKVLQKTNSIPLRTRWGFFILSYGAGLLLLS